MNADTPKGASVAKHPDDAVVLMYPNNQLKKQEREFKDTMTAFSVVNETFFRHAAQ